MLLLSITENLKIQSFPLTGPSDTYVDFIILKSGFVLSNTGTVWNRIYNIKNQNILHFAMHSLNRDVINGKFMIPSFIKAFITDLFPQTERGDVKFMSDQLISVAGHIG